MLQRMPISNEISKDISFSRELWYTTSEIRFKLDSRVLNKMIVFVDISYLKKEITIYFEQNDKIEILKK